MVGGTAGLAEAESTEVEVVHTDLGWDWNPDLRK